MFNLCPVSSELFVRQNVFMSFLYLAWQKHVEFFIQIYIILPPIIVFVKVSCMPTRYIVSDDLFVRVTFSNWQYSSIGLDSCWTPTRQQTIIWTNDGKFTDAYMDHSASMG